MIHSHLIVKTSPVALAENVVLFGDVRVTVLTETLFRVEKDSDKRFCDEATQSIWFRNTPPVSFEIKKKGEALIVKTAKATLTVKPDIMASTVSVGGKTTVIGKIKNLPGAYRSLDRCNGDVYIPRTGATNNTFETPTPITLEDGIVSLSGVGLHNDTEALILNAEGRLVARDDDELDIYLFAHGKNFRGALCDLYTVSGKVPMIPRYALGNWWSRYHAYTEREYLHILDRLAERDVPITVATIDMDWHWSTTLDKRKGITESGKNDEYHGGNNGWTGYSWNTDLFPDYKSFLGKIQDRELKITLNLHPADGIRYFEDMYEDMAKALELDPKTEKAIPFDFTSDKFINAYFDILHKPYEHDGVEFWWIDWQQGHQTAMPGLDPLWALNHYHTLDNAVEHTPLILSRYCKIGSHRYPLGFSGDTYTTWESLDYIPYFTAMGTNAGYTWWSHDIGGHMLGFKDDELYTRYIQFGVFSPINRLHCSDNPIVTKEPEVYMNGQGLIAEEFLRLRHRMIPFLYSASYETSENGAALIEPMYYAFPEEKDAYKANGQYLFGGKFIVAPVTKKGDKDGMAVKKVWLPEGKWTDIFTGACYEGGRWVEMTRFTDTIPVLAAEGAIFPLDARRHTNCVDNPNALEVMVFSGNGEYVFHEDKDGSFMHTHFESIAEAGRQTLIITTEGDRTVMPKRRYRLQFKNIRKGDITVLEGKKEIAFDLDDAGDCLELTFDAKAGTKYTVTVCHEESTAAYRNSRITYALMRLAGENSLKQALCSQIMKCETDDERRAKIDACDFLTATGKKYLKEAW